MIGTVARFAITPIYDSSVEHESFEVSYIQKYINELNSDVRVVFNTKNVEPHFWLLRNQNELCIMSLMENKELIYREDNCPSKYEYERYLSYEKWTLLDAEKHILNMHIHSIHIDPSLKRAFGEPVNAEKQNSLWKSLVREWMYGTYGPSEGENQCEKVFAAEDIPTYL